MMLQCWEHIDLLRPARWVRSRLREQNRQGYLWLSIPEMGIMNVQVHMVAVRSSSFNPAALNVKSTSSRPVMGLFIRHSTDVKQYTFKDTITGKVDRIKATPNHPFYAVNQQRYIPVSHLSPHDLLINVLGHPVILVCPTGKSNHCGQPYYSGQVIPVYNLEVYGQHRYFVGEPGIMVHNGYYVCEYCAKECHYAHTLRRHITTKHPIEANISVQSFTCDICGKTFDQRDTLTRHLKSHSDKRPFKGKICEVKFKDRSTLNKHLLSQGHIKKATFND